MHDCKSIKDFTFVNKIKTSKIVFLVANELTEVVDFSTLNKLDVLDQQSNKIQGTKINRLLDTQRNLIWERIKLKGADFAGTWD